MKKMGPPSFLSVTSGLFLIWVVGHVPANLSALPADGDIEACGYEDAKFQSLMLPVLPADPLKLGKKKEIVFDLLITAEGGLMAKGPVYAPSKAYLPGVVQALGQSRFSPALECDQPVAGFIRHTVTDYFFPTEPDSTGEIIQPRPLWVLDRETMNQLDSVCNLYAPEQETLIRFRIDATGTITHVDAKDNVGRALTEAFFDPLKSKLRFEPAIRSGEAVASRLTLRLSEEGRSPYSERKNPDPPKLLPLPRNPGNESAQVFATIQFGITGEIVAARVGEDTPTDLATAVMQAVRSWSYPPQQSGDSPAHVTITCRFGFEPGEAEAFLIEDPEEVIFVLPSPTKRVSPAYPYILKENGISGITRSTFTVDTRGKVRDVKVIQSTHKLFSDETIECLYDWRFEPGTRNGEPISFQMMLPMKFKLNN